MEFIIISVIALIIVLVLKLIFNYNLKELKVIGEDDELDKLTSKYPSNIEMCKEYLEILKNESVTIEENKDSNTSLYIVITNKISIANVQNSYTRIQTIAHECLHSIQDKKMLIFNFVFSNIYLIYFFVICVLAIFKFLPSKLLFLNILTMLSLVYFVVRAYLENDAMIKARYLAKEYMEQKQLSDSEEINKIVGGFDKINKPGIKAINYNLFLGIVRKIIIFSVICIFG